MTSRSQAIVVVLSLLMAGWAAVLLMRSPDASAADGCSGAGDIIAMAASNPVRAERRLRACKPDAGTVRLALDRALDLQHVEKRHAFQDPSYVLIKWVGRWQSPQLVTDLEQRFAALSFHGRSAALAVLAGMGTEQAVRVYVRLVQEHHADVSGVAVRGLRRDTRFANILFPGVMDGVETPRHRGALFSLAARYIDSGALPPQRLATQVPRWLAIGHEMIDALGATNVRMTRGWLWSEERNAQRDAVDALFWLLASYDDPGIDALLRRAMAMSDDPLLMVHAVRAMVSRGGSPERGALASLAADPLARGMLHRMLQRHARLDLFPPAVATQAALAQSDMANWIFNETGVGPAAVESKQRESAFAEGVFMDIWLYRWRIDHPHYPDTWFAGMAGPFPRDGVLRSHGLGRTFSSWTEWEQLSPSVHVERMQAVLEEWCAGLGQ